MMCESSAKVVLVYSRKEVRRGSKQAQVSAVQQMFMKTPCCLFHGWNG